MICDRCGHWIQPTVKFDRGLAECGACGHGNPRIFLPLFVVTGASGTGKTTVIPALRKLLPSWDIFEVDVLQDSQQDWQIIKCNWLRVAHSVHQSGRLVMVCGSTLPPQLALCDAHAFFPQIHWLALTCDAPTQETRLRARPPFRGSTDEFMARQDEFRRWFLGHGHDAFDPPLMFVDTTTATPEAAAAEIAQWALRLSAV